MYRKIITHQTRIQAWDMYITLLPLKKSSLQFFTTLEPTCSEHFSSTMFMNPSIEDKIPWYSKPLLSLTITGLLVIPDKQLATEFVVFFCSSVSISVIMCRCIWMYVIIVESDGYQIYVADIEFVELCYFERCFVPIYVSQAVRSYVLSFL